MLLLKMRQVMLFPILVGVLPMDFFFLIKTIVTL